MAALNIDDVVTAFSYDAGGFVNGCQIIEAGPINRMKNDAAVSEDVDQRRPGAADEPDGNALGNEARKQVAQEFLATAPASEVIDKKDLHR